MHYALYMIFLTFDLSTPVKYERIGVYESVEECEEMRNAMASDIWSDENNPAFARNEWVEMELNADGTGLVVGKTHPMPLRFGCVSLFVDFFNKDKKIWNQYMSN